MRVLFGALFLVAIISGCAITNNKNNKADVVKNEALTASRNISHELHQILDGVVFEGNGVFKYNNKVIAKNGALIIATNDIADQVGKLLVEKGTTLTEKEIKSVVNNNKINLIYGYSTIVDAYDKTNRIAEIIIRQDGKRIATQIAKITIKK